MYILATATRSRILLVVLLLYDLYFIIYLLKSTGYTYNAANILASFFGVGAFHVGVPCHISHCDQQGLRSQLALRK